MVTCLNVRRASQECEIPLLLLRISSWAKNIFSLSILIRNAEMNFKYSFLVFFFQCWDDLFCFVTRLLRSPPCPILEAFGKKISFEVAVGLNGRVWVIYLVWLPGLSSFHFNYIIVASFFFFTFITGLSINCFWLLFLIEFQVNAASPSTVIIVANAIMRSESLSVAQQKIMVEKLLQNLNISSESNMFMSTYFLFVVG